MEQKIESHMETGHYIGEFLLGVIWLDRGVFQGM